MIRTNTYANLPDTYQQVEWIENTKGQYINTGFTPNQNTGFEIDFLTYDEITPNNYGCIFGARKSSGSLEFQLTTYNNSTLRKCGTSYDAGLVRNTRIQCSATATTYFNPSGISTTVNQTAFTAPCPITIFTLNNNGSVGQHGYVRLYSFKLYDNGVLARDYIPCYRISDGKVGLYDLVNSTFNTDVTGGNFTHGEEITGYINKVVYGSETIIDLTADTVDPDRMYKGDTAHAADGSEIVGTAEITVDGMTLVMPEGLCDLIGTVDPETHHWIRPEGLPDLDSIYNDETNTLYMTVDATGRIPDPHVSIKINTNGSSTNWTVQVGSIQNGEFIVDSTETLAHAATWIKTWTPSDGNYPIVKITSSHIRSFQWQLWTSDEGRVYNGQYQPIIEWVGHVEAITSSTRTPYFTEREKIIVGSSDASGLAQRWDYAYHLVDLDVSEWDTSSWPIATLSYTWRRCVNLLTLDLSSWNVSSWKVTNLANTWTDCNCLISINTDGWNTSNWAVTTLYQTWCGCYCLESLNLNHWDTSNWAVTTLYQTWYTCTNLRHLAVDKWDTSKWKVTSMTYTWNNCYRLAHLDLSGWTTANWKPTSLNATWSNCMNLKELHLNHWDTSNWAVNNINTTWNNCYLLEVLDVKDWDTSKWPVTSFSQTWYLCYGLKELDLSNWDTSNWVIPNLANTWNGCRCLEILDLDSWDVSNWTVTSMANTWANCVSLKYLHVHSWNTSNWVVTELSNTWAACYTLQSIEAEAWDTSNWAVTNMSSVFNSCCSLESLNISWDTSNWPLNANTAPTANSFRTLVRLKSLDLSAFDISKFTNWKTSSSSYTFQYDYSLMNITFGENNRNKMNYSNYSPIYFANSPLLTVESILNIFDALADGVTNKTLQLGSENLNKLTAEEKAIATNKGWTLT